VFGELVVGLILGPSLIDLTHLPFITDVHLHEIIRELGELGVLLLMFLAGLELEFSELARNTRVSAFGGLFGVFVPVLFGFGVGLIIDLAVPHALFLGLTLGATSVSISAQTLMELGVLRSRVGLGLLGAAVFDDIIVILLLSTFTALLATGGAFGAGGGAQILVILLRMIIFFAIAIAVGLWALPWLARKVGRMSVSQGLTALGMVTLLLFGIAAELIGEMAAITGAFLAGLMFARTPEKKRIENGFNPIAYGLFVPIFFVDIGLRVNIRELQASALWFLLGISILAVLGKIIGAGAGSRLGGFSWWESLQLGVGMVSRGEVGLIVASVGLGAGLLNQAVFSSVVGMILITTLVTPPLLRLAFAKAPKPAYSQEIPRETGD
jgi:Kef-type K+ transport system membrane component KefB